MDNPNTSSPLIPQEPQETNQPVLANNIDLPGAERETSEQPEQKAVTKALKIREIKPGHPLPPLKIGQSYYFEDAQGRPHIVKIVRFESTPEGNNYIVQPQEWIQNEQGWQLVPQQKEYLLPADKAEDLLRVKVTNAKKDPKKLHEEFQQKLNVYSDEVEETELWEEEQQGEEEGGANIEPFASSSGPDMTSEAPDLNREQTPPTTEPSLQPTADKEPNPPEQESVQDPLGKWASEILQAPFVSIEVWTPIKLEKRLNLETGTEEGFEGECQKIPFNFGENLKLPGETIELGGKQYRYIGVDQNMQPILEPLS